MSVFTKSVGALLIAGLASTAVYAWNLPAKRINALKFEASGDIRFTLFDQGSEGPEFLCGAEGTRDRQWFVIPACEQPRQGGQAISSSSILESASGLPVAQCYAATDRMATMLLSAKLAHKLVHVQRDGCVVSEVALKP